MSDKDFINKYLKDYSSLVSPKEEIVTKIIELKNVLINTKKNNSKVLIFGNGGSAAESQHMAAEYCATLNHKNFRSGFAAMSLTVDTSFITAWSNDFGYENVFSRQVEALGNEGDILFCYSTSGTSKNVLSAISMAKSLNI